MLFKINGAKVLLILLIYNSFDVFFFAWRKKHVICRIPSGLQNQCAVGRKRWNE